MLIDLVNMFLIGLAGSIGVWMSVLPQSPVAMPPDMAASVAGVMKYANYFLPITELSAMVVMFLPSVAVWYGAKFVLRWSKAVQ
jgi:hypothetical protein